MQATEKLPRVLANAVLSHAQRYPDTEVCGLIGRSRNGHMHCYPGKHAAAHPAGHGCMDPREHLDAMRQMREHGEELYAIYRSRPHSPAFPTVQDIRDASWPDSLYLLVSLGTRGVLEMRGYRFASSGTIKEIVLEII